VAAGAVKVAALVVWLERAPPPLTLHVTPALFESLVTLAVRVVVSLGSTVLAAAETETLLDEPPPPPLPPLFPPHPERPIIAKNVTATNPANAVVLRMARI
jgi:hypothetical protein